MPKQPPIEIRKNKGKGYNLRTTIQDSDKISKTRTGSFGVSFKSLPNGSTVITRRMNLFKKTGRRKSIAKVTPFFNSRNNATGRTVKAHGFADILGGPAVQRNLTYTTKTANDLDTLGEHKMRLFMKRPNKPGPYFSEQTETIDSNGNRIKKETRLQRRNSLTELHVMTTSQNG
ncbi:hypothetical protein [Oceanobacter mangrovi]|uniref:hypothetical protein n=1 Tax=Oceanobacter mangrovi TaxID=2862510 RepID=UPI001C8EC269|nr:hypothetical protein [Oceanobacter mangrovi]